MKHEKLSSQCGIGRGCMYCIALVICTNFLNFANEKNKNSDVRIGSTPPPPPPSENILILAKPPSPTLPGRHMFMIPNQEGYLANAGNAGSSTNQTEQPNPMEINDLLQVISTTMATLKDFESRYKSVKST